MFRWPTSELPIWPSGKPTASPDASTVVRGFSSQSRSMVGVWASEIALAGPGGAQPQPAITISTSGRVGGDGVSVRASDAIEPSCFGLYLRHGPRDRAGRRG